MAGGAGTSLLVGWVFFFAAGIADAGRDDALDLVEGWLHAPETATGKGRFLETRLAVTGQAAPGSLANPCRNRTWRSC